MTETPAPLRLVALLFPRVTQLDLTGPVQVFSMLPGAIVDLAWHDLDPVYTGSGFSIVPTVTYADAPQADILLVPGGGGALELMADEASLDFVRAQASGARLVTSVCTGAFVLGAAGLLQGRRATTHWASLELLSELGAIPTKERVVRDGDVVTGAGVTSGIDLGLTIAAEVYGEAVARRTQLQMEYDPAPPFDAGSPSSPGTDPEEIARISERIQQRRRPMVKAAARLL